MSSSNYEYFCNIKIKLKSISTMKLLFDGDTVQDYFKTLAVYMY